MSGSEAESFAAGSAEVMKVPRGVCVALCTLKGDRATAGNQDLEEGHTPLPVTVSSFPPIAPLPPPQPLLYMASAQFASSAFVQVSIRCGSVLVRTTSKHTHLEDRVLARAQCRKDGHALVFFCRHNEDLGCWS